MAFNRNNDAFASRFAGIDVPNDIFEQQSAFNHLLGIEDQVPTDTTTAVDTSGGSPVGGRTGARGGRGERG